jgi:hypothetical protein
MTIEVMGVENPTDPENVFYDARCLRCNHISSENGDFLDRPLEIIGFEENATFKKAQSMALEHDNKYPDHRIVIRGYDTGKI